MFQMWHCAATVIIAWLIYQVVLLYNRRSFMISHGCEPPPAVAQGFDGLGIGLIRSALGDINKNRMTSSLAERFDRYGSTFTSRIGSSTRLFTIDPANLQAVFSSKFQSWGVAPLREFNFGPLVGHGIMTADGPQWEQSRAMARPAFTKDRSTQLVDLDEHVQRLITKIPEDGSAIDLQPLFVNLALDTSTEILFGTSTGTLSPAPQPEAMSFLEAFEYGQRGCGKRAQMPRLNILTRDSRFWKSCAAARKYVEVLASKAVNEGRSGSKEAAGHPSIATTVVESTPNPKEAVDKLLNLFMPAHDAIGVLLTNVFFCLARHPTVYAKLRTEVTSRCGDDGAVTSRDLKEMLFLQSIINETMRIHPPVGQMSRIALEDTVLPSGGGTSGKSPVFAPKGTIFTTSFYALHRDKQVFGDDAEVFRPDRWEGLRLPAWRYLPFSGGPRLCLGQQLGITQSGYALAKIVQKFESIENADPVMEFVELARISTSSANGAQVRLKLNR